jgi:hypothetical protein
MGLLKSALAMPSAGFVECYAHNDLFEMAAAYLTEKFEPVSNFQSQNNPIRSIFI